MDDKKYDEVKDVNWVRVEENEAPPGAIKFKCNNKRKNCSNAIKVLAFILIASASGGITGGYVAREIGSKTYNYSSTGVSQTATTSGTSSQNNQSTSKNAITKVAATVGPAVVGIESTYANSRLSSDESTGSGIIIDSNGYIVTNNHVISGATKITVKLSSGKTLDAKLVGADSRSDLAVIKVEATNLPTAKLGDSSKVQVGDVAIAIGSPLGDEFSGSVTAGIISALNRQIQYEGAIYNVLQTDAAINPGNSGGALCNEAGEVIGINSLKIGAAQNAEGMGFAISINEAKSIIQSLMSSGKVSRAYLGIYGATAIAGTNSVQGVYVKEVVAGSGADKAGIKPTDIITELDDTKVTTFENLSAILDKHKVGDTLNCIIWRNGKTVSLKINLTEMPNNQ
ncbi:MAG: S1C family serine protease [Solirubrobacterales bacterium]